MTDLEWDELVGPDDDEAPPDASTVCDHCGQLVPPILRWLHEVVRPQAQERHLRRDKEDYR